MARLAALAGALLQTAACGVELVGWPADTDAPTIVSTSPLDASTGASRNALISVTFSEEMDAATVDAATFFLMDGGTRLPAEVTLVGATAMLDPALDLLPLTEYTATIAAGVTDEAGLHLAADHVWTFTTGGANDTQAPVVSFTTPPNNGQAVALNSAVSVQFSELMNPATIGAATFFVMNGTDLVAGEITYTGVTATFRPAANLAVDTSYTATVAVAVADLAGNTMSPEYTWTFQTGHSDESVPPLVTATVPASNATGAAINGAITATFSEAMDPSTVSTATFMVSLDGNPIAGAVSYAGVTATFVPEVALELETLYAVNLNLLLTDLAGNRLVGGYAWNFTTGLGLDVTPPVVLSSRPVADATDVARNSRLVVTFSEALDASTVTASTFTVLANAVAVPGTVSQAGAHAVFVPTTPLAANADVVATIDHTVADLAGNELRENFILSFQTGNGSDVDPPEVSATEPRAFAGNVAINASISATFSEPMDPSSFTTSTFALYAGLAPVTGSVSYDDLTATFEPREDLATGVVYTARITDTVTDLAGNELVEVYAWTFTTHSTPDTTAPSISSTVPERGAIEVVSNAALSATFSEAMATFTLNPTTVTLRQGTTAIPGVVRYVGRTVTFDPSATLASNVTFTATIAGSVTDLAGNAMGEDHIWSFTTGDAPDLTAPRITATMPSRAAVDVSPNAAVTATFTEAVDPATISTVSFSLRRGSTPVAGTVRTTGATIHFDPLADLESGVVYTARVRQLVTDLAGNHLASDYEWTFTVGTELDLTPPVVSFTTPLDNARFVATNSALSAGFSEAIAAETVTRSSFVLTTGTTVIPCDVYAVGVTAVLTPRLPLLANTTYSARITTDVADLAGNTLVADYTWTFVTQAGTDTTRPQVSATFPDNGETGVGYNNPIAATFSEPMLPASLSALSFTLRQGTAEIAGTVNFLGVTATLNPFAPLAGNTTYTATITTMAADLAGNTLAEPWVWSFTTGNAPDLERPEVTSHVPDANERDVAVNIRVTATFSESMNPLNITPSTFSLFRGADLVPATVSYVGRTATLMPTAQLLGNTTYTARVSDRVTDLAGNRLVSTHAWTFVTGTAPDETAPRVTYHYPASGADDIGVNATLTAVFSEPMDPTTISVATFAMSQGATPIAGTVTYVGRVATFNPTASLEDDTFYTVRIRDLASDLAGNRLAAEHVWTFMTRAGADETPPQVSATVPANGATLVPANNRLTATFSEDMDPLTITTTSFTLRDGTSAVVGSVTTVGLTAIFDPSAELAANTTYTATVRNTVADLAGNRLADAYIWSFTTGAATDTTRPEISDTSPGDDELEVALNAQVLATFSEAMAPWTITTTSFTVSDSGGHVAGSVTALGNSASFRPTVAFAANTTYVARVSRTVRDLANNTMAADHEWTFSTGPAPDITRPRVSLTVPAAGNSGVSVNSNAVAVFTEPMSPATVNNTTFVMSRSGTPVTGSVLYIGVSAIFDPSATLAANTTYTATMRSSVRDLAGNTMAADHVWTFRTGAAPDTTRPQVVWTIPSDGATAASLNTNVTVTFSESMAPASITTASMRLFDGATPIAGRVTSAGATVVFNPTLPLNPVTSYRVLIANSVTDLAGNHLRDDYEWTFTSGAAIDNTRPTVDVAFPEPLAVGMPLDTAVHATFSEDMAALSVTSATMELERTGGIEVTGSVSYDAVSRIATFRPRDALLPSTTYTARVRSSVTDLAGNRLAGDFVWVFATGTTARGLQRVDLGSLSTFAVLAGVGIENSNSSGVTLLNGDAGIFPGDVCLGDGLACTSVNPVISGTLYADDEDGVAELAQDDLTAAFADVASRTPGTNVSELDTLVLDEGVYWSNTGMNLAPGGVVTLDGHGDADAVWIFRLGTDLTIGDNAEVVLVGGAQARNVYWVAGDGAAIGSNVSFQGTVMTHTTHTLGADSIVTGRMLCSECTVELISDSVLLPTL